MNQEPEQQKKNEPEPKPKRRDLFRNLKAARRRGNRRALLNRWGLRNLPPLDEDEP